MVDYDYLVNNLVDELYKKLSELEIRIRPKAVVLWANEEELEDLKDRFEVSEFSEEIRGCDVVVVPRLSMESLCNLAFGRGNSSEEKFILEMLMKGKKVFALRNNLEYKRYKTTAPKFLYNKYVDYETEICQYGIKLVDDLSCIYLDKETRYISQDKATRTDVKQIKNDIIRKPENCINRNRDIETDRDIEQDRTRNRYKVKYKDNIEIKSLDLSEKRLITESSLRKYKSEELQELIVDKNSIITPLASDFVRIHHLNLIRV
ncbi:MAG: ethanolamine utilization protein [Clostridioides sp.]|jgi:ethanolamine utilization protein|nr:ethanolamine utilization protein [Clostridioides sp.]